MPNDLIPIALTPSPDFPAPAPGTDLRGAYFVLTTPGGTSYPVEDKQVRVLLAPNDRYEQRAPTALDPGTEGQKWYHKKTTSNNFDQYQYEAGVWALRLSGIAVTTGTATPNAVPLITLGLSTANLILGQTFTLSALAEDSDGTITRVDFFEGGTFLRSVTTAPFLLDVTPATAGTKSYTATTFDNLGASRSTPPQSVQVFASSNQLPVVSLNLSNTTVVAQQTLTLSAVANDPDGSIARVEFYDGSTLIGSDTESPYSVTYAPTATGNRQITAKAIDNAGGSRETPAKTLTVTPAAGNQAPVVSYSQSASSVQAGTSLTLSANASDADGTVSKVEFYQGGNKVGEATSAPFAYVFTPAAAGTFLMSAKATDNLGATTTTGGLTLTVTAAPTPNTTPPAPTFSGFLDTQGGGEVTLDVLPPLVLSDYRVSLPGSTTFATPVGATITVPNAAGTVRAYVAAGAGRNQSPTATSDPFTAYTAPPVPPSWNTSINGIAPTETADGVEMTVADGVALTMRWNAPLPTGDLSPASMGVYYNGSQLATVYFNAAPGVVNTACEFEYQGVKYQKQFSTADITLS